jgi:uncharacterized protein (UPF0216 family)
MLFVTPGLERIDRAARKQRDGERHASKESEWESIKALLDSQQVAGGHCTVASC